jgi:hypothetical protein
MVNPHVVELVGGEYVNDCGDPVDWTTVPATLKRASWNSLRVDHFVTKSRREFETKARRGRADQPKGVLSRDDAFFASRDRNETFDPMPAEFVQRTKDEMTRMRDRLKAVVVSDSPLQSILSSDL